MQKHFFTLIALACSLSGYSQHFYKIQYKTKHTPLADVTDFFSKKAIENRTQQQLSWDNLDLPVDENMQQWSERLGRVIVHSRWFNASFIETDLPLSTIELPENVAHISEFNSDLEAVPASYNETPKKTDAFIALAKQQTKLMQRDSFLTHQVNGKGVRIAVFDVGFNGIETHPAFEHLYTNKQIVATKDFIKNKEDRTKGGSHGTAVLSCISGYYGEIPMGLATKAEFLLARTEHNNREPAAEEAYWSAAAEWADQMGAQIISSSLGYTYHRYLPSDMDGKTSLVARAATMASKKGILVVNAMGNDGSGKWRYLGTPADADSVLSVGGISPFNGTHISFSSYGPNNNGVMKPNVSATGYAACAKPDGTYAAMNGTSFATPLISGLAACVWQMHPEYTNMEVKAFLEEHGHLNPYYDYALGFGVPQVFNYEKGNKAVFELKSSELKVSINPNDLEKETDNVLVNMPTLYIKVNNSNNQLIHYYTYKLTDPVTSIQLKELPQGGNISTYYQGHYETIQLP